MELWIRSQKNNAVDFNQSLIKINKIYLDYCGENDGYFILVNEGIEVAYYNTEKRALEVLDEIQKLLKPQLYLKQWESVVKQEVDELVHIVNPTYEEVKELSTYVYEMPEE